MIRTRLLPIVAAALAFAAAAMPAAAADTASAEIGYMPILPDAQLFVGLEDGSIENAGIDAKTVSFQNGPAMVQALASGQLDIAYFGIGPAMVARGKGADIKVVASNIMEQVSFIALPELAGYFAEGDTATAFARFAEAEGRPARIATFPRGSVPQTVFDYWLAHGIESGRENVEIIGQGTAQVQQSLLTGAVDGAAILEPIISIVQDRRPDAQVIAGGETMFPGQPGAVLAVRQAFIDAHPDVVGKLVAAHAAATDKLRAGDDDAIAAVGQYVGGGRLPEATVRRAVMRSEDNFAADPNAIIDGTRRMRDFQAERGTLKADFDIDALFDTRFYDALARDTDGAD